MYLAPFFCFPMCHSLLPKRVLANVTFFLFALFSTITVVPLVGWGRRAVDVSADLLDIC